MLKAFRFYLDVNKVSKVEQHIRSNGYWFEYLSQYQQFVSLAVYVFSFKTVPICIHNFLADK
jgi:hypothetical protein